MHEDYFQLDSSPFKLIPDPAYFYGSQSHNKAMAYLHYGLRQAEGFIVITGPIGSGKSMVIGHLLDQLDRSDVVAAQLLPGSIDPSELVGQILASFRIEAEVDSRTGRLEAFEDYLFDMLHAGRRALLVVDEAQSLTKATLEELRMLSNLDYDGTPLMQVFLVGQPEFREDIAGDDMEQLRQRVIASYHLENLTKQETREYILHRLSVAGWKGRPEFSEDVTDRIHGLVGGRPRRINTLCSRIMLTCAMEKSDKVSVEIVNSVFAELEEERTPAKNAKKLALAPMAKAEKPKPLSEPTSSSKLDQPLKVNGGEQGLTKKVMPDQPADKPAGQSGSHSEAKKSDAALSPSETPSKPASKKLSLKPLLPGFRRPPKPVEPSAPSDVGTESEKIVSLAQVRDGKAKNAVAAQKPAENKSSTQDKALSAPEVDVKASGDDKKISSTPPPAAQSGPSHADKERDQTKFEGPKPREGAPMPSENKSKEAAEKVSSKDDKTPAKDIPAEPAVAVSMFDRLRAMKSAESEPARQEATLTDVASAIADVQPEAKSKDADDAAEKKAKAEAEAKREADEVEAKRKSDAEAKNKAEAKRKADEAEAKRKAEAEAKRKADEVEAKRKLDAEAKNKAEAKRKADEAEAKRKADAEAKSKAEAKRKADEAEAKAKKEAQAKAKSQITAKRLVPVEDTEKPVSLKSSDKKPTLVEKKKELLPQAKAKTLDVAKDTKMPVGQKDAGSKSASGKMAAAKSETVEKKKGPRGIIAPFAAFTAARKKKEPVVAKEELVTPEKDNAKVDTKVSAKAKPVSDKMPKASKAVKSSDRDQVAATLSAANLAKSNKTAPASATENPVEFAEWKKSVLRSVSGTRNELMQAHASVVRLQQSLDRMRKRRDSNRQEIEKSLVRAQSLLDELKDVWR